MQLHLKKLMHLSRIVVWDHPVVSYGEIFSDTNTYKMHLSKKLSSI